MTSTTGRSSSRLMRRALLRRLVRCHARVDVGGRCQRTEARNATGGADHRATTSTAPRCHVASVSRAGRRVGPPRPPARPARPSPPAMRPSGRTGRARLPPLPGPRSVFGRPWRSSCPESPLMTHDHGDADEPGDEHRSTHGRRSQRHPARGLPASDQCPPGQELVCSTRPCVDGHRRRRPLRGCLGLVPGLGP